MQYSSSPYSTLPLSKSHFQLVTHLDRHRHSPQLFSAINQQTKRKTASQSPAGTLSTLHHQSQWEESELRKSFSNTTLQRKSPVQASYARDFTKTMYVLQSNESIDMEEVKTLRVRLSKALVLIHKQVAAIKELTETNEMQAREIQALKKRLKALQSIREIPRDLREIHAKIQANLRDKANFKLKENQLVSLFNSQEEKYMKLQRERDALKESFKDKETQFKEAIRSIQTEFKQWMSQKTDEVNMIEHEHVRQIRNLKAKFQQFNNRAQSSSQEENRACRFEVILSKTEASD